MFNVAAPELVLKWVFVEVEYLSQLKKLQLRCVTDTQYNKNKLRAGYGCITAADVHFCIAECMTRRHAKPQSY